NLFDRQRLPQLLAGVLVEGDDRAAVAADQADQLVAVDERVRRPAPDLRLGLVVPGEVLRPDDLAGVGFQTEQVAHAAERIHLALVDDGRGARPFGVGDLVGAVVLVLPEELAVGGAEAQDALAAGQAALGELLALGEDVALAVHDVDLAAGDGRA